MQRRDAKAKSTTRPWCRLTSGKGRKAGVSIHVSLRSQGCSCLLLSCLVLLVCCSLVCCCLSGAACLVLLVPLLFSAAACLLLMSAAACLLPPRVFVAFLTMRCIFCNRPFGVWLCRLVEFRVDVGSDATGPVGDADAGRKEPELGSFARHVVSFYCVLCLFVLLCHSIVSFVCSSWCVVLLCHSIVSFVCSSWCVVLLCRSVASFVCSRCCVRGVRSVVACVHSFIRPFCRSEPQQHYLQILRDRCRCAPPQWTILQQDGPNHLGFWYNVLSEH